MFSMPPATMIPASPARMICDASVTDFSPEPHSMLMVVAGTSTGSPAPIAAWRAGILAEAGLQHAPEQDLLDLLGRDLCPLERRPDRMAAQLGGGHVLEIAAERPDRRSHGTDDDRLFHDPYLSLPSSIRPASYAIVFALAIVVIGAPPRARGRALRGTRSASERATGRER